MNRNENGPAHVEIDGASIHITGDKGEEVKVGPGGVHVKDGDAEVKVSWTGIHMRDGKTKLNINFWKPLLGCGFGLIIFAAAITIVVVGIIKLMM